VTDFTDLRRRFCELKRRARAETPGEVEMQIVKPLSAAAILAAAMLLFAAASQERAAAQSKLLRQTCTPGFTANAISQSANVYVCQSAVAVCAMRPGMNVTVQPLRAQPGRNGFTLKYSCTYQPMSNSPG
jgi:hypothetical protein